MQTSKRTLTLFLVVSVLVSTFPFAAAQEADEVQLSVSVDEVYVLRGGSFHVDVSSNYSSVGVEVYAPSGSLYTSWIQAANTSRLVNVPAGAPYGTYMVKALVEGESVEAYVSVLDVTGWSSVSFPYTRSDHLNVDYTFFANGTIKAQQLSTGDVLEIDLSMLRNLNGEFAAYANSMCFRVRFTKAPVVVVDLTFAFVHTGCKFIVNGTLDQPRDFTFHVANPQKLKGVIDGFKQGSLVFDWSDLCKVQHAFSYDRVGGLLSLSLPQTFSFDPTIFSDGFESGDLSGWSSSDYSSGETVAASEEQAHHGDWSGKFTSNGGGGTEYARVTQSGLDLAAFYFRAYVYVTAQGADASGDFISFIMSWVSTNTLVQLGWYNNAGTLSWWLRSRHGTSYSSVYSTAETRNLNEWYCIEVYWENAASANVYGWVNGNQILNLTGRDTNNYGNADRISFGLPYCYNTASNTLYGDCAVADDSAYIGPEAEGTAYDVACSWATGESFTVATQWQAKKGLTLQAGGDYAMATQWNAAFSLSVSTAETYSVVPQASYRLVSSWSSPLSYSLLTQADYGKVLGWAAALQWSTATQSQYKLALVWQHSTTWNLLRYIGYSLALSWQSTSAWGLLTQNSYRLGVAWQTPESWQPQTSAIYHVVLSFAQAHSWSVTLQELGEVIYTVLLSWGSPGTWASLSQTSYHVVSSWGFSVDWLTGLVQGVAQTVVLAWQTAVDWATAITLTSDVSGGEALAVAVAFPIVLFSVSFAFIFMRRRRRNREFSEF